MRMAGVSAPIAGIFVRVYMAALSGQNKEEVYRAVFIAGDEGEREYMGTRNGERDVIERERRAGMRDMNALMRRY